RPEILELFGDKARARAHAASVGVLVLAGTSGPTTLDEARTFLTALAPDAAMMLKASGGGGGRGMRIVRHGDDLDEAYARCQSEARAAFGNDELYVEEVL